MRQRQMEEQKQMASRADGISAEDPREAASDYFILSALLTTSLAAVLLPDYPRIHGRKDLKGR